MRCNWQRLWSLQRQWYPWRSLVWAAWLGVRRKNVFGKIPIPLGNISDASYGPLGPDVDLWPSRRTALHSLHRPVPRWQPRVGLALSTIDSNIWVAHIAGLPASRHFAIIAFCATNTCSAGISIPRSPRAIITPSASSMIESTLAIPWRFSILATILIPLPSTPNVCLIWRTASALRTNDAKTISHWCFTANCKSCASFSETAGKSTSQSGKLTPLQLPNLPPCSTTQSKWLSATSFTSREMRPSSIRRKLAIRCNEISSHYRPSPSQRCLLQRQLLHSNPQPNIRSLFRALWYPMRWRPLSHSHWRPNCPQLCGCWPPFGRGSRDCRG
ncbi:conserved hypothetical protein [Trichinella spiralis]|uniref:hypothetical protein n=1 Tax=Trichinella spiralis TaxID=6334 RepID=UPI0001EFB82D|nr:conserved hypothetical protein [Trichinella spiralis]